MYIIDKSVYSNVHDFSFSKTFAKGAAIMEATTTPIYMTNMDYL